jgi:hypothetical protein
MMAATIIDQQIATTTNRVTDSAICQFIMTLGSELTHSGCTNR